jgi:hypothetical protein
MRIAKAGFPPLQFASCDRNFLAGQGIVHSDRKIASQLSPLLIAIRPSSKLKGYRTGAEVEYVDLRQWFFCYTRMSSGSTFQQFDHALVIGASNHVDGDFDRAFAIRKGPVSHLTRDERSIRHDDFRTVRGANDTGSSETEMLASRVCIAAKIYS